MNDIKPECLLFLSWQSDRKDCRKFVNKVVEKLSKNISELVTVLVDRDTMNVPGSPDIGDTIFEKIDKCDLFIADITLINDEASGYRRTPNPNVMIELGYAIKTLGWERIILLQCKDYGDVEELPFDINHRRICSFSIESDIKTAEERAKKKQNSEINVVDKLKETITILLDKKMLFGGNKGNVPKFEILYQGSNGIMSNLCFVIKNVSSILVSCLQSQGLTVVFNDGATRIIPCDPEFEKISLGMGEKTILRLNNQILGAGPGNSNAAWNNFDLHWQLSCEDEYSNVFWYEMKRHVDNADNTQDLSKNVWSVRYIG